MKIFGFLPTGMLPVSKREMNATPTPPSSAPGVPSSTVEKEQVKGGSFEERIVRVRDPQKALTVSAVYRATELRAKTIGQMPVQYQRIMDAIVDYYYTSGILESNDDEVDIDMEAVADYVCKKAENEGVSKSFNPEEVFFIVQADLDFQEQNL